MRKLNRRKRGNEGFPRGLSRSNSLFIFFLNPCHLRQQKMRDKQAYSKHTSTISEAKWQWSMRIVVLEMNPC